MDYAACVVGDRSRDFGARFDFKKTVINLLIIEWRCTSVFKLEATAVEIVRCGRLNFHEVVVQRSFVHNIRGELVGGLI